MPVRCRFENGRRSRTQADTAGSSVGPSCGLNWAVHSVLGSGRLGFVKRSTAIGRLREVAESLDRLDWLEPKIVAAYVHGEILTGATVLDRVEIVLVVDAPPEVVPWMARPPHLEAVAWLLRFPKLPLSWCWRPAGWPVWNHRVVNPVRFWILDDHVDTAVFEALTGGGAEQIPPGEGPADVSALVAQLETERQVSRLHLDRVLAGFYEREWRREHRGDPDGNGTPQDHLWWAAAALLELDDAISVLATGQ